MSESIDRWFENEILVHEASLTGFLRRSWPNLSEIEDIRQDIYVRVYRAAMKSIPYSAKSFLFTTARNLLIDRIRRSRVVSIEAIGGWKELDNLDVFLDEQSQEDKLSTEREFQRLVNAVEELPPRAREVLWLRRVEDIPQKEVARQLNVSEGAVEKSLARAVRLLARSFFGGGSESRGTKQGNSDHYECERKHGQIKRH